MLVNHKLIIKYIGIAIYYVCTMYLINCTICDYTSVGVFEQYAIFIKCNN